MRVSMDGRRRCLDNMLALPAFGSSNGCGARSNTEAVYLRDIAGGFAAQCGIDDWINFYNQERPHAALGKATPDEAYG